MQAVVRIIGAGLAGSEAAWQCARRGVDVELLEMRPVRPTPAHQTTDFAELVCSNSLKSDSENTAPWLLKEEMQRAGSLLLRIARECAVPAGHALAVDRVTFAAKVTEAISRHPQINVRREEAVSIEEGGGQITIIATGPLTSEGLAREIARLSGGTLTSVPEAPSVNEPYVAALKHCATPFHTGSCRTSDGELSDGAQGSRAERALSLPKGVPAPHLASPAPPNRSPLPSPAARLDDPACLPPNLYPSCAMPSAIDAAEPGASRALRADIRAPAAKCAEIQGLKPDRPDAVRPPNPESPPPRSADCLPERIPQTIRCTSSSNTLRF